MDVTLQQAVDFLVAWGIYYALPALALAALIEYVFPPFPGDTVVLAGAVLARIADWNYVLVFAALTAGNLGGAALDYYFGRRALSPQKLLKAKRMAGRKPTLDRLINGYRRYGPALLVINRFLPGIRALFFVAAGMAELDVRQVLLYAGVSAALWTILLLVAGAVIGENIDELEHLFGTYFNVLWMVLGGLAVLALVWWVCKRVCRGGAPHRRA